MLKQFGWGRYEKFVRVKRKDEKSNNMKCIYKRKIQGVSQNSNPEETVQLTRKLMRQ